MILAAAALNARTAMDFFLTAPQSLMIYADSASRLDMRDYYESGVTKGIESRLGKVRLDSVTPGTLHLKIDSLSEMSLAVVPVRNDTVLAIMETVRTPIALSSIHIYNKDWTPRKEQPALPDAIAFGAPAYPGMFFVSVEYDAPTNTFRAINNTKKYYLGGDVPEGVREMKDELRLRYDGRKFKAVR